MAGFNEGIENHSSCGCARLQSCCWSTAQDSSKVANPPLARNAGTMDFDKIIIDGVIMSPEDAPRTFEYSFVNRSISELVISKLVSTCSCATATYDKKVVKPGERGVVRLIYNPKGRVGTNLQRVFVYTDDNLQPTAILRLEVTTSS